MPNPSQKTQNLVDQLRRREPEMNPDELRWTRQAIRLYREPHEVGELRKFCMQLFTRLNARKAASKRKAA